MSFSEPGVPRGWKAQGRSGARPRTYNSSMTTRNKRCIRLVSLDGHKTLTPLIASKLRVSRVTPQHRSGQVPGFLSPPVPGSLPLALSLFISPSALHVAHCTSERSPRQSPRYRVGTGWVAEEPEGKRCSFLFSSDFPSPRHDRATSSRDNFHEVVSAFSELSFLSHPFSSTATTTIFQSLFESHAPSRRSNLVTSV